ncbi:MAG: pentapeptide repeat-containing protein [Paludibacteraceae bacterium]|nr:pentapeptide repeat-containing protein [Paludibacteraceae bacterium]
MAKSQIYFIKLAVLLLFSFFNVSCGIGGANNAEAKESESTTSSSMTEYHAADIVKMIKKGKPVQLMNCMIWDDLDFTQCGDPRITSGVAVEVDVEVPLYFNHCLFMGNVVGKSKYKDKFSCSANFRRSVTFSDCDFRGEVDFTKVMVADNIDFSKSTFSDNAKFDLVELRGGINRFYEITADKHFSFTSSYSNGNISFMDATFKGDANFHKLICSELMMNNTTFEGDAIFSNMTVRGSALFNYSKFNHDFDLSYSKFLAPVIMTHAEILGKITLNYCVFNSPSRFSNSTANVMDMSESLFFFFPDLSNVRIDKVANEECNYSSLKRERHIFTLGKKKDNDESEVKKDDGNPSNIEIKDKATNKSVVKE